jgi:hypothetical protein
MERIRRPGRRRAGRSAAAPAGRARRLAPAEAVAFPTFSLARPPPGRYHPRASPPLSRGDGGGGQVTIQSGPPKS